MSEDTNDSAIVVVPNGDNESLFFNYLTPFGKIFEGRYRFPGGKLKEGEDFTQALNRELLEEYGVSLKNIRLNLSKPNVLGGLIHLCSADIVGSPHPLVADVGPTQWGGAEDLFSSNMVPNCKIALYSHLFNSGFKDLKKFHPILLCDYEFLDVARRESPKLYEMIS